MTAAGWVRFDRTGDNLVVRLIGEIDESVVRETRARVHEVVAHETGGPITVDLSMVTFLDSSGLGMIAGMYRRSEALGPLTVHGASAPVRRAFQLTGLDGPISINA